MFNRVGERTGSNGGVRTAWVQGTGKERKGKEGKEGKGRERKGQEAKGRERMGKEGKGRERMGKDGKGRERVGKERKWMGKDGKGMEQTDADGLGAREWLEMDGEKKPLVMSELGCADGCGRGMGAEKCADGFGWRECNGVAGNGWGEEAAGDERAWLRGRLRTANFAEKCVDGCGRRGCKGVAGNGWGEKAAGDERAWLRGRLRTGNGCGEVRGRFWMARVQRRGWKWMGRRSR